MKTYSELAQHLAIKKGIKVVQHYGTQYNDYSVFVPRIYSCNYNNAKVRILRQGDNVKNCLKITFDPDKWTKGQIESLITSNIRVFKHNLHGSCQSFMTINNLTQILVGIIGRNGIVTKEAKLMLNAN